MEKEVEINTQGDIVRNKTLFIWTVMVVFSEFLAGIYTVLSFFSIVPFSIAILFMWFGFLLLVNSVLFYVAHLNWRKIGIRSKVAFILWSSIVLWYWVFSPIFYIISMYYTHAQLQVVSFTYFWEVPVIGGLYVVFCLMYFRPMYHYMVGEKSGIKSPQEAYDFLHQFSYKAGIALVVFVIGGFIIGSFQQVYFAQLPVFGQVKLIMHGVVSSFLSGLYVMLILDRVFNAFRRKIRTENLSVGGFTQKTIIASLIVIVASIGLFLIVGIKISQDLIKNIVTYNTVSNFEDVTNYLNKKDPDGVGLNLNHLNKHLGSRVEAFVFEKDFLNNKFIAPETMSYIKLHQKGEVEDNRAEIKVVVFRTNPDTFMKEVVIVYLADYYSYFLKSVVSVGIAGILVVVFVSLIMILFTRTVTGSLKLMKKSIQNGENDVVDLKLSTGDEFEEFANNLSYYARQAKDLQDSLEDKIKEKTGDLAEKVGELQETNSSLENMDKAMINILEDAKEVEDELKVEKAGVETKVEERTLELTDAQARLTASINNLPVGFVMVDTKQNVIFMNGIAKSILCLKQGNHSSGNKDNNGEKSRECDLNEINKRLKGRLDIKLSIDKVIKNGQPIDVKDLALESLFLHVFIAPISVANEKKLSAIGAVILVENITDAKVLERSRDEFFSIASHELRTPLTSIRGNTSMIMDYLGEQLKDPQMKEMIDDIHESSVRLIEIVNDFLDLSRLEQGRIEFKKEVFDMVPLIEKVVYDVAITAKEKKLTVKFDQPSAIHPNILADSARTKQVIYNILGNAIKYTDKGGVTITIEQKDKAIYVRVTDTGKGIPQQSQSLLFRKFQQAENNILTRDGTQGTGLGLYISKLMAQGMGGDVVLESSEENKGSTFLLSLPVADRNAKQSKILPDSNNSAESDTNTEVKVQAVKEETGDKDKKSPKSKI